MDDRQADPASAPIVSENVGVPSANRRPPSLGPSSSYLSAPILWCCNLFPHPRRLARLALVLAVFATAAWLLSWRSYGWYHLYVGKRCLQADHFRDALHHFQRTLEVWPDDAALQFLAARAARRAGDFELADGYLTKCRAVPAQAEAAELERVLLRASRGEIDAVGDYCRALLQQDHPDTPLILEALAQGELKLLRFGAASAHLDRWLEIAPDHAQAIFLKGRLQLQASNSQEAIGLLRRAVELDPNRDDARILLAGLHLDLGQAQEALPHLQVVASRQPHNVPVQARLAQALVLLGREQEALKLLDQVLDRRPDLVDALLERGKLALRAGELDKAEEWLQLAAKRDAGNRAVHYQLLQCLKRRGKDAQARAVQERLSKIDQDAARMREIVTVLLPTRRLDPDLQAELGAIFLRGGASTEGIHWLHRALEIAPRHAAAHHALVAHYQSLGQFGQAQHHRALAGPEKK